MAVFFWMLVEGLNLYRGTVLVFITTSRMKVYYIIGWGTPLLFVITTAAVGQMEYMREDFCWISHQFIWAFAGPVAVILFINLVILCIAIRVMVKRPRYKINNKVTDSNNATAEYELRIAIRRR
ncbi:hypothetical protein QZH41_009595 [Actinostola sp. cb2023]|nr:hypothetical protein QZH41_009595 [Actinostola sp. cb2023]